MFVNNKKSKKYKKYYVIGKFAPLERAKKIKGSSNVLDFKS